MSTCEWPGCEIWRRCGTVTPTQPLLAVGGVDPFHGPCREDLPPAGFQESVVERRSTAPAVEESETACALATLQPSSHARHALSRNACFHCSGWLCCCCTSLQLQPKRGNLKSRLEKRFFFVFRGREREEEAVSAVQICGWLVT